MFEPRKLRHRLEIQEFQVIEDSSGEVQDDNGALVQEWVTVATVWAAIEPISAREFVSAQADQSKVVARITIRYRTNINSAMRLYHAAKDSYYNIEGILSDKQSGLQYLTLPCSEGVRYAE